MKPRITKRTDTCRLTVSKQDAPRGAFIFELYHETFGKGGLFCPLHFGWPMKSSYAKQISKQIEGANAVGHSDASGDEGSMTSVE